MSRNWESSPDYDPGLRGSPESGRGHGGLEAPGTWTGSPKAGRGHGGLEAPGTWTGSPKAGRGHGGLEAPGFWRRLKNRIFGGEREPDFSFQPDRQTILLARDLLLARRAQLGFMGSLWVPARNRYEIVRAVFEVCERSGIHQDEAIGWLGITRAKFQDWLADYDRLAERFEREEEIRQRIAGVFEEPWRLAILSGLLLIGIVASILWFDRPAVEYFAPFDQKSEGMRLWVHITFLGDATLFHLFTIFGILLTWTRDRRLARGLIYFYLSLLLAGVVVWALKILTGRPRPELFLADGQWGVFQLTTETFTSGLGQAYKKLSFPSGHATHGAAVAVSLSLLFPRYRYIFLLYPLSVGISRVVLIQHFPGDVLAGWAIGGATAILLFNRMYPDPGQ